MGLYRINVTSSGKYGNTALGHRYVFSKRKAKEVLRFFVIGCQAHARAEKFVKSGDCWTFSLGDMMDVNEEILFEAINKGIEMY